MKLIILITLLAAPAVLGQADIGGIIQSVFGFDVVGLAKLGDGKSDRDFGSFLRSSFLCPSNNSLWDCAADCKMHHEGTYGLCEPCTNYCICYPQKPAGYIEPDLSKGPAGGPKFDENFAKIPASTPGRAEFAQELCTGDCQCFHKKMIGKVIPSTDTRFHCSCEGDDNVEGTCNANLFQKLGDLLLGPFSSAVAPLSIG